MPEENENKEQLRHRYVAFLLLAFVLLGLIIYAATRPTTSHNPDVQLSSTVVAAEQIHERPQIKARAAIVYDAKNNEVLFEKNAEQQLPLASITKILLALVAVETLEKSATVSIPIESLLREGDNGFIAGEQWNVQDLIDFTLVASSNDGADALARAASPYIYEHYEYAPREHTALWRMNHLAQEIGMNQTFITDPTGLDISGTMAGAYGSARDIAQLFLHAFAKHPEVIAATAQDNALLASPTGTVHEAYNTNEVLGEIPGLIAGKTGFTDLAGGNLAVIFDASIGHPVIVVVLGSSRDGRFNDVQKLVSETRKVLTQ